MMKKIYNTPEINVIEQEAEPFMLDTSIISGGEFPGGPVDSKGAVFEDEDDDDDWNGWN